MADVRQAASDGSSVLTDISEPEQKPQKKKRLGRGKGAIDTLNGLGKSDGKVCRRDVVSSPADDDFIIPPRRRRYKFDLYAGVTTAREHSKGQTHSY